MRALALLCTAAVPLVAAASSDAPAPDLASPGVTLTVATDPTPSSAPASRPVAPDGDQPPHQAPLPTPPQTAAPATTAVPAPAAGGGTPDPRATPSAAPTPPAATAPLPTPARPPTVRQPTLPGPAALDVRSRGVVADGRQNDTPAIQAVLDAAPPDAVVYFPDAGPGFYRLEGALRITKPLTLIGAAGGLSELRQLSPGANAISIESSGVTIERLRLLGPGYTSFAGDTAVGLRGTVGQRLTNISVFDSWMQGWSNAAIRWSYVDDFVVSHNHIEDCTYAGVLVISGRRGLIADNEVVDIGHPDTGAPLENAYSISVTSEAGAPYSEDVVIRSNTVRGNPIWSGIMNHGGSRILIDSNTVTDADVAYALTWVPRTGISSDDTLFVNNTGTNAPRNSLWLTGADATPNRRARAIGNRFTGSASIIVYNTDGATVAWNTASGTVGAHGALRTRLVNTGLTVAANNWNGAAVTGDGTVLAYAAPLGAPPAPAGLSATRSGGQVALRWAYDPAVPHDSFLIEHRPAGGEWQPLAYRPPNDGLWDFTAPTNRWWVAFDPLSFVVDDRALPPGERIRIRAQLGGAVSAWSPEATVG